MKKTIVLVVAVISLVSCMKDGSFKQSYTLDVTFEYPDEVYAKEFNSDSVYVAKQGVGFVWMNSPLLFAQKQNNGVFRGGFAMSYLKGKANGEVSEEEHKNDLYRVNAVSGSRASKTYAVFYDNPNDQEMHEHDIEFGLKEVGTCSMLGCYVNNTTHVARMIKEHFEENDKLVLKAIGHGPDGKKTETKIVMAEYTAAKDSIMYNWTPFDLSVLGAVEYVDFEVESTNPDVPGFVCVDGVLASINISY